MAVLIDDESLETGTMGLTTVGEVLAHLQRDDRLVTNLLIDGEQPDLTAMADLKSRPLAGHTIFIETARPQALAVEVMDEVDAQLADADDLKAEAVEFLQQNQPAAAMQRLSGCFSAWNAARESLQKTAQLLRLNIESVQVAGRSLAELLKDFTEQLRQVRNTLEGRDFVSLADVLQYEMTQTTGQWREAVAYVRRYAGGAR